MVCSALAVALAEPAPGRAAMAAPALAAAVAEALAEAGTGTRIGLVVADARGGEIVAVRPDERFVPASNTKMVTTAAAFVLLDTGARDGGGGATIRLEGRDVVLSGHGDARLSSADDCTTDCLIDLARTVAARTRVVRDVVGDDSAFPDERWPQGMSWNNMPSRYGTAVSALTIDDNVVALRVTATTSGAAPVIVADSDYVVENCATTAGIVPALAIVHVPGSRVYRVTGTIPAGAAPVTLHAGIDDPAARAAWQLARMLRTLGVRVTGRVTTWHRPVATFDDPATRGGAPAPRPPRPPVLARLAPPPLVEDLRATNKASLNLHAELLLRRVGALEGTGSVADGQAAVQRMLDGAGIDRRAYDFADGAGMSTYNRLTPRAAVAFLRWTQTQTWGAAWRATLPVGGVDGTLARRFRGTALEGRIFAKTGTLNAANALSGFMLAASGQTLVFSALANDMPGDAAATMAVDKALLAIAAAN